MTDLPSPGPDDETSGERVLAVVFNPTKREAPRLKDAITAAATETGWGEPIWIETTADDPGLGQSKDAIERGATLVIAAGGDGTVRSVAEGLRGSGVAMGIVPVGTGNLLARNLSLPLNDIAAAAKTALTSDERAIDVGVAELTREDRSVDHYVFCVMAGLGIDAAMIKNTSSELKAKLGWIAYVGGIGKSLAKLGGLKIRYRIDDDRQHGLHISSILIGNCGLLPGNLELMPDAKLDDGRLDVAVLQPRSIFGWLAIWRAVTWENRVLNKTATGREFVRLTTRRRTAITYLQGETIGVLTEHPETFEVDGDEIGDAIRMKAEVDPGGLLIRAPR